jgi:putative ABC transport system permease protein
MMTMITNYIIIALRNLKRNKTYSVISIAGLAIGMVCFLSILLFIQFERSYDAFHTNGDRIYRLIKETGSDMGFEKRSLVGAPVAQLMKEELSAVENRVRFSNFFNAIICSENNCFNETHFYFADEEVLEVFRFPLRKGNPATALAEPFSVVLTPQSARKYFGDEDPMNKTITYHSRYRPEKATFRVTGVLEEIPHNSHIKFDFLASYGSIPAMFGEAFITDHWDSPTWVYLLLHEGYTKSDLEPLFPGFVHKHVDMQQFTSFAYHLQPLRDIYYNAIGMDAPIGDFGIRIISNLLLIIGTVVLIIACINYINLATARSISRAREIGVRKVLGADRKKLIQQFVGESIMHSFIALIAALVLMELTMPSFQNMIQNAFPTFFIFSTRIIEIHYLQNLPILLLTALIVGIVSGVYPAFVLSSHRPTYLVRGDEYPGSGGSWLRKGLVIAQFSASVVLIIGAVAIIKQIDFLKNKELGFDSDRLLTIPIHDTSVLNGFESLKAELLGHSHIEGVTAASQVPGITSQNALLMRDGEIEDVMIGVIFTDVDYIETMGIELVYGNSFAGGTEDVYRQSLIINEAAARHFGWDAPVGKNLELYFKQGEKIHTFQSGSIIGVAHDFNFRELNQSVQPILIMIGPSRATTVFVRLNPHNVQSAIAHIETVWDRMNFDQGLEASFLADDIRQTYLMYDSVSTLMRYGAYVATMLAGVGLFGLAFFLVERRTKEISIRKVLGASAGRITMLLSKSFVTWILIGNVIAWPIAYYIVNGMLAFFAYQTKVSIWIFIIAGLITVLFGLITVSYQVLKAAAMNPVENLKYE